MFLKKFLQGRAIHHPLHPLLVHLPVGLWMASFVFDLIALTGGDEGSHFATASFYCIGTGLIGAILAVPPGMAEYLEIPDYTVPKKLASRHMTLNFAVLALYGIGFFLRRGPAGAPPSFSTAAFSVSAVAITLLVISGYLGGRLVYEYSIGYRPSERDTKILKLSDRGPREAGEGKAA